MYLEYACTFFSPKYSCAGISTLFRRHPSLSCLLDTTITANSEQSIDYYQSQLDYRESFEPTSPHLTSFTATPANRKSLSDDSPVMVKKGTKLLLKRSDVLETHCLLSQPTQHDSNETTQASNETTYYSESMVVNPPQWHFDVRSCTPLDQLHPHDQKLYNILFHLSEKTALTTIHLKKTRRNGTATADITRFLAMDNSGSVINLTLWDEAAVSLHSACLVGDIIYLSGHYYPLLPTFILLVSPNRSSMSFFFIEIAVTNYQGKQQASSTGGTRAQICYRLRPTHRAHLDAFCPDLRLAYDDTTRRVSQLVLWAKALFS
ncbi:hypothetical protein VP01_3935g1 [Puccinia sorghi]|uniref:Uncharacterized protein n=1 Tax=Puccinia sorghi TaxID=27349 RepID=A0A0L6USG6_9BASI|nr:hypothetical protein VP01_3935g1 [Puccinia sorghi]